MIINILRKHNDIKISKPLQMSTSHDHSKTSFVAESWSSHRMTWRGQDHKPTDYSWELIKWKWDGEDRTTNYSWEPIKWKSRRTQGSSLAQDVLYLATTHSHFEITIFFLFLPNHAKHYAISDISCIYIYFYHCTCGSLEMSSPSESHIFCFTPLQWHVCIHPPYKTIHHELF